MYHTDTSSSDVTHEHIFKERGGNRNEMGLDLTKPEKKKEERKREGKNCDSWLNPSQALRLSVNHAGNALSSHLSLISTRLVPRHHDEETWKTGIL